MDDLISRQVAIDALCEEYCNGHHDCKYYPRCENLRWIQELPSAQPEIIRCKDCRNYINNCCYERKRILTGLFVHDNDFCSWAERRTDE